MSNLVTSFFYLLHHMRLCTAPYRFQIRCRLKGNALISYSEYRQFYSHKDCIIMHTLRGGFTVSTLGLQRLGLLCILYEVGLLLVPLVYKDWDHLTSAFNISSSLFKRIKSFILFGMCIMFTKSLILRPLK